MAGLYTLSLLRWLVVDAYDPVNAGSWQTAPGAERR